MAAAEGGTTAVAAAAGRALERKAEGSHLDSPDRRIARTEIDASALPVPTDDDEVDKEFENFNDTDVKGMMRVLMKEIRKGRGVAEVANEVAEEAKQAALEAKAAVQVVKQDIVQIKSDVKEIAVLKDKIITKEKLPELLKELSFDPWANAARSTGKAGTGYGKEGPGSSGKAVGKGKKSTEEKSRTLYFGNFPDDTTEETITGHIKEWTTGAQQEIEEIHAFGKLAERGAARFKSEQAMWDFMITNRGKLKYEVMGVSIYANPDSMHDPTPDKSKAIRKVVRLIIESNGGDGQTVKKDIITKFGKGKVYYKKVPVAAWDELTGKIKLLGEASAYQDAYNKLMGAGTE
jgi:hypothetical protein